MKRFNLVCFCLIAFSLVDKDKVIRNPPTGLIKIIQRDNFPERPHIYKILLAKYSTGSNFMVVLSIQILNLRNIDLCSVPCARAIQRYVGVCRIYHRRVKSEPTNKSYRFRKYSSIGQTNNQGITHYRTWILRFEVEEDCCCYNHDNYDGDVDEEDGDPLL